MDGGPHRRGANQVHRDSDAAAAGRASRRSTHPDRTRGVVRRRRWLNSGRWRFSAVGICHCRADDDCRFGLQATAGSHRPRVCSSRLRSGLPDVDRSGTFVRPGVTSALALAAEQVREADRRGRLFRARRAMSRPALSARSIPTGWSDPARGTIRAGGESRDGYCAPLSAQTHWSSIGSRAVATSARIRRSVSCLSCSFTRA
jgi:hypothetical protein